MNPPRITRQMTGLIVFITISLISTTGCSSQINAHEKFVSASSVWSAKFESGHVRLRVNNPTKAKLYVNTYSYYYAIQVNGQVMMNDYSKVPKPTDADLIALEPSMSVEWNIFAFSNGLETNLDQNSSLKVIASRGMYKGRVSDPMITAENYLPEEFNVR